MLVGCDGQAVAKIPKELRRGLDRLARGERREHRMRGRMKLLTQVPTRLTNQALDEVRCEAGAVHHVFEHAHGPVRHQKADVCRAPRPLDHHHSAGRRQGVDHFATE
jgi:hypothetical protein